MSARFVNRASGTAGMVAFANDAEIRVDSADELLKYYDKTGAAVRKVVTENQAQSLSNKTLVSPAFSGASAPPDFPITTDAADAAVSAAASGITVFTKGSASAHTLAAPARVGIRITLCAGSAQAHVITATGLVDDGVTGGSKTTLTLASFIGATVTLIAVQAGKWMVESKNVCVIT